MLQIISGLILSAWLFTSFNTFAHTGRPSPEVITQSITTLLPRHNSEELQAGDLLVLDLDNTVFREVQLLGTDDWYTYAVNQLTAQGLSSFDANNQLRGLNRSIKTATRMRLMEEGMPGWIRELQEKNVNVIGLTARHPELSEVTLKQLADLNIRFQPPAFPDEKLASIIVLGSEHRAFLFSGGVAFVDGAPKGHALKSLLAASNHRPPKVFAIDDRIYHVHSFVEALLELGIEGRVIHYLKALEEPPFNTEAAEFQKRYFEATGHLMSDERAKRECELQLDPSQIRTARDPEQ